MNNFHGDLGDIFRLGNVNPGDIDPPGVSDHWQYFEPEMIEKSTRIHDDEGFGQPFASLLSDPLIHEGTSTPCFFGTTSLNEYEQSASIRTTPLGFDAHKINDNHNNRNHNQNIFSKVLQISPNAAKSTLASTKEVIISSSSASASKRCLLETSTTTLQISSPRNPAIKRR